LAPLSQDRDGTPTAEPAGTVKSCRADPVAAAGQFSWPPAGSYLAVYGQFLVAVVSWCCRAADGSALGLGELSVPGDRTGPDRPDATLGRALWPVGRRRGVGCRARRRAGTGAPGQRLDTVPRRDHRLRPGTASSVARSPASSAFSRRAPCRIRARRTAMTSVMALTTAAAATCLRRRNAHLPGTIRQPLQITAELDACAQNGPAAATAPEGLFCGAVPARAGMDATCCMGRLAPVRRGHPEAGLTCTRKAVASPAQDLPGPGRAGAGLAADGSVRPPADAGLGAGASTRCPWFPRRSPARSGSCRTLWRRQRTPPGE
jgi:hypothetical protein